jgi:hypothetical protein
MSRKTSPGPPDLAVVHEVIRLDDALVAAERSPHPKEELRGSCLPEREALFAYLWGLPDVRMVELHALYWLGNQFSATEGVRHPVPARHEQPRSRGLIPVGQAPGPGAAARPGEARLACRPDRVSVER